MDVVMNLRSKLEALYLENRQQLYTCALAIVRCPEGAEDAVQEAFSRLFVMGTAPGSIRAYVFRAVRNAALDQRRRKGRIVAELSHYIFDPRDGPHETALANEFKQRVVGALLDLDDEDREIVIHRLYVDLTFREISEVMDLPLSSVAYRYRQALQRMRSSLKES